MNCKLYFVCFGEFDFVRMIRKPTFNFVIRQIIIPLRVYGQNRRQRDGLPLVGEVKSVSQKQMRKLVQEVHILTRKNKEVDEKIFLKQFFFKP